jgi:diaminohydroxyphosphoribosylaminopyrimidine deaminase / 5-amino-6-(5-phosphoribosylamino)uracil reductase
MSPLDSARLTDALALASSVVGLTDPNPRVGCVIGLADGTVLGQGATQAVGGPHAEVVALRDAANRGAGVAGATAWVTLEPCAHHGRTPPCCDALVAAGLARVVVLMQDPFPAVCGQGIRRMREHGIQVDVMSAAADPGLMAAAWQLNIGFFSRVLRGRPWVRVKVASSLDGRTTVASGASQWITGQAARADGHAWRQRASAVLTGIGTVLADDPRLDVRHPAPERVVSALQPLRVVLDSHLRTPLTARLLQPPGAALLVGANAELPQAEPLRAAGAEVIVLGGASGASGANGRVGRVDLATLMAELNKRQINELHVEAGATLNSALMQGGWVDEWLLYVAPRLFGAGTGVVDALRLAKPDEAQALRFTDVTRVGDDLRLLCSAHGHFGPLTGPG